MENKNNTKKVTKPKKEGNFFGKIVKLLWLGFFAVFLGIAGTFWAASNGWLGEIPNVRDLENPDIYVSSEIISSDGVLLDRFETERRTPCRL
jgi:Membrane carboxypeptidase/penicillin-binding protein